MQTGAGHDGLVVCLRKVTELGAKGAATALTVGPHLVVTLAERASAGLLPYWIGVPPTVTKPQLPAVVAALSLCSGLLTQFVGRVPVARQGVRCSKEILCNLHHELLMSRLAVGRIHSLGQQPSSASS